ncbi:hypothetical protein D0T87_04865 [Bacteroides sp. 51]|nr:hypothetical protein [Bacteroides sp. 51]
MEEKYKRWIIQIKASSPCFVSNSKVGDPPRTLLRHRAKMFKSPESAAKHLEKIKKDFPFREREYRIVEL